MSQKLNHESGPKAPDKFGRQNQLIKTLEAHAAKPKKRKPQPATRAAINKANAQKSTGPKTTEGKAKVAGNSLKHGFFAKVENLHPADSTAFIELHQDLRMGLQPDGPAEEHLVRELAMFSARLARLEAAEYALLAGNMDANPADGRVVAEAFARAAQQLEALHKIEVHLRRAYNRSWDRLDRMQKARKKLTPSESEKQSQRWLNYYRGKASIDSPPPPNSPTGPHQPTPDPRPIVPDPPQRTGPDETQSNPSSVVRDQERLTPSNPSSVVLDQERPTPSNPGSAAPDPSTPPPENSTPPTKQNLPDAA